MLREEEPRPPAEAKSHQLLRCSVRAASSALTLLIRTLFQRGILADPTAAGKAAAPACRALAPAPGYSPAPGYGERERGRPSALPTVQTLCFFVSSFLFLSGWMGKSGKPDQKKFDRLAGPRRRCQMTKRLKFTLPKFLWFLLLRRFLRKSEKILWAILKCEDVLPKISLKENQEAASQQRRRQATRGRGSNKRLCILRWVPAGEGYGFFVVVVGVRRRCANRRCASRHCASRRYASRRPVGQAVHNYHLQKKGVGFWPSFFSNLLQILQNFDKCSLTLSKCGICIITLMKISEIVRNSEKNFKRNLDRHVLTH